MQACGARRGYTVKKAVADWLDEGPPGRTAKTVEANRDSLWRLLAVIGTIPLKDPSVQDVRAALKKMAGTHTAWTLQKAHDCLETGASGCGGAGSGPAERIGSGGYSGRPEGAAVAVADARTGFALLEAAESVAAARVSRVVLADRFVRKRHGRLLGTTWILYAGTIMVWRSVRAHGDTKTNRSRRTLKLPEIAVEALRAQKRRQAEERARSLDQWQELGLVFTTSVGTAYEPHNLRRDFRQGDRGSWARGRTGRRRSCGRRS